jgi:hypothetical protein
VSAGMGRLNRRDERAAHLKVPARLTLKWIFPFWSATFGTTRFENCSSIEDARIAATRVWASWRSFARAEFDGRCLRAPNVFPLSCGEAPVPQRQAARRLPQLTNQFGGLRLQAA